MRVVTTEGFFIDLDGTFLKRLGVVILVLCSVMSTKESLKNLPEL